MTETTKDKCENCGKEVEAWLRVCSRNCAGAMGGKAYHTKPRGFAANKELAVRGGQISRKGKKNA